jgi:hypothetical protein
VIPITVPCYVRYCLFGLLICLSSDELASGWCFQTVQIILTPLRDSEVKHSRYGRGVGLQAQTKPNFPENILHTQVVPQHLSVDAA